MKRFLVVILTLAMAVSLFACGETTTGSSADDTSSKITEVTLLSQGKRTQASVESGDMKVYNIADGDASTFWANGPCEADINEWFYLDLGQNVDLSSAKITWGVCRATSYKLEISRGGVQYETAYEVTDASGKADEITFEEGTVARYLRVSMTKADAANAALVGVAVCEFEVYGIPSDDQTLGNETEKIAATQLVELTETNTCVTGKNYNFNDLDWQGGEIAFKVTGGSVVGFVAKSEVSDFKLNCSIDGGEFFTVTLKEGEHEYIIAEELEDTSHEVRIVRSTQSRVSGATILSAIIYEKAALEENYEREYDCKLWFLGDSITAGGLDMFTNTYGFIASEQLNAQSIYNAVGGGGVHELVGKEQYIPDMFMATNYMKELDYDFEFQPDIIILSAGVNDQNPYNQNGDAAFRENYLVELEESFYNFLKLIHEKCPDAKILYSKSAGMKEGGIVQPEAEAAIERIKAEYSDLIIETLYCEEKIDTIEDGWHPGPETHARDGIVFAQKIKEMLELQ